MATSARTASPRSWSSLTPTARPGGEPSPRAEAAARGSAEEKQMGHVPWYEWQNLRNRLLVFGRAIQGASPYRVLIEADPAKCPTGYCDFTHRTIAANPTLFPDLRPRAAFQI